MVTVIMTVVVDMVIVDTTKMVDNQTKRCYNSCMNYENLTRICGGNITPGALKLVLVDIEFQTTAVKQEFWQYMFEMGETFGDIQSFVVQDRHLKDKEYA